jgi:hypothetical protein
MSGRVSCRQLTRRRWAGAAECTALMTGSNEMILNPDHVTMAVADAGPAIEFFALLGFRKEHVATIDGGLPARSRFLIFVSPAMICLSVA